MPRGKSLSTEAVLQKAVELAKTEGIDAVTYNGLARELEIRPQSMYRYVKDLKELRVLLLGGFLTELVEKVRAAIDGTAPAEALRRFAVALYDECHANPWYYESFNLMHRYEIVPELAEPLGALVGLVQTQMEKLDEASDAPRHTQLFMAVMLGYAQMAMTEFVAPSLRDSREGFVRSVEEFIRAFLPRTE